MTPKARTLRPPARRRTQARVATLSAAAVFAGVAGAVALAASDDGQSGGTATATPVLGLPVNDLHLIGTAGDETWGWGRLVGTPARADGTRVPSTGNPTGAVVFVSQKTGSSWRVVGEPLDLDGSPIHGEQIPNVAGDATGIRTFTPENPMSAASMHRSGAAAVFGQTTWQGIDTTDVDPGSVGKTLLVRDPGGPFRLVAPPGVATAAKTLREVNLIPGLPSVLPTTPIPQTTPPATTPSAPAPAGTEPTATPQSAAPEATTPPASATPSVASSGAAAPEPAATTPVGSSSQTTAPTTPDAAPPTLRSGPAPTTPTPDAEGRAAGDDVLRADEVLADARRIVMAVEEPSGKAGALVGVLNTAPNGVEDSVFHFDGANWRREPLELTAGQRAARFELVAIAGTGLSDAWLLARPAPSTGQGLLLFQRDSGGVWKPRSLGSSPYATRAPAGTGATELAPLRRGAQALTVSDAGVWVDGSFRRSGQTFQFTVHYDKSASAITGSWCDAGVSSLCQYRLGVSLDDQTSIDDEANVIGRGVGYKSFAWSGSSAYGQRIITNPLIAPDQLASARGNRLVLQGTEFRREPGIG
ncbi:MAG: hypothetical protein JHD16_18200, partial [Solirubrobacteraceae bacterium]|nr:hypothetical protein [Solirubrobacteraceae bacterium]